MAFDPNTLNLSVSLDTTIDLSALSVQELQSIEAHVVANSVHFLFVKKVQALIGKLYGAEQSFNNQIEIDKADALLAAARAK